MNKLKQWIALILAVVLVGANVIYQAGINLSASESASAVQSSEAETGTDSNMDGNAGTEANREDSNSSNAGMNTGTDVTVEEVPAERTANEAQIETQAAVPTTSVNDGVVTGSGFDQIRIKFDTSDVSDQNKYFRIHVQSEASARASGFNLNNGVGDNMNKNWTGEYSLYNLAQKEFKIWLEVTDANKKMSFTPTIDGDLITFTISDQYISHYDGSTFVCPTASSLGSVNDFAVFAKEYVNTADMEGNIATKKLYAGTNGGNTDHIIGKENNLSYVEEYTNFNNIGTIFFRGADPLIVGDSYKINKTADRYTLTKDNVTKDAGTVNTVSDVVNISNSSYQIDFDAAFQGLEEYASALYNKTPSTGIQYGKIDDKVNKITFPKENQNYIINVKLSEMNKWYDHVKLEGLGETGSVVFNIEYDVAETLNMPQHFDLDGVLTGYEKNAGRILLNFGTQKGGIVIGHADSGVVLAPKAEVSINGTTHNGSVFAEKVTNTGAEIHKNPWKSGPDEPNTPDQPDKPDQPENPDTPEEKSVDLTFTGKKSLTGMDPATGEEAELQDKQFSFDIIEVNADGSAKDGIEAETVKNDRDGYLNFQYTYKSAGEHYYKVTENQSNKSDNITYDNSIYLVHASVTESDDVLTATVAEITKYADADALESGTGDTPEAMDGIKILFENKMKEEKVKVSAKIDGKKYVDDREARADEGYQFTLTRTDETYANALDGDDAYSETVTAGNQGEFSFELNYDQAGIYYYTVSEKGAGSVQNNIYYDETVYHVQVTIDAKGEVTVQKSASAYEGADEEELDQDAVLEFHNYGLMLMSMRYAQARITGTKTLAGGDLKAGEFRFGLYEGETLIDTATNDGNGKIAFRTLPYYEAGTHHYMVKEIDVPDTDAEVNTDPIEYDASVYDVTVTVTDDMNTSISYTKDGQLVDGITFENKTSSAATVIDPGVTKVLENGELQPGQFSFQLLDENGQVLDTKRNTDSGSVLFDSITYDKEGRYHYTIKEVIPENVGQISYDTKEISVAVEVEKNAETGDLQASVTYYKDGKETENPQFVNRYHGLNIRVQKRSKDGSKDPLQGAVYALYQVMGANGRDLLIGTQVSGADGYMTFTDIKPGVYYFKEVSAPAGHTVDEYATERFTVTVDGTVIYGTDTQSRVSDIPVVLDADQISDSKASESTVQNLTAEAKDVSDEVTKLNVSKLDAANHEYVSGAKMQIIEKSSGNVVCEWTTDQSTKALERVLNVDTVYILREASAPEGYDVAQDTEFRLDQYGNLTVISGSDAKKKGDISLNVYDKKLAVTKINTNDKETRRDKVVDLVNTVRTGDNAKIGLLVVLVAAAAVVIIVMVRRKMKNR